MIQIDPIFYNLLKIVSVLCSRYSVHFCLKANSQVDLEESGTFSSATSLMPRDLSTISFLKSVHQWKARCWKFRTPCAAYRLNFVIFHRDMSTILFWSKNSLFNILALLYYNGHKIYTYDYINAVAYYFKIMYKIFLCICLICCVSPHLTVSDQICHKMFSAMCILKTLN